MKKTPKRRYSDQPQVSASSSFRSSIKRTPNYSAMGPEIVPDSMAVFPMAPNSRAALIDDDDVDEYATPKPATPKRQRAARLLDDDALYSPIKRKPTPSGRQFDINEDSPQRPTKKVNSSFLRPSALASPSTSTSAKQRQSRNLDFFHNVELPTASTSFASSSMRTLKKQKTAISTLTCHASSSRVRITPVSTPTIESLSLQTPKMRFETPMTPQKTGVVLVVESPTMATMASPELFSFGDSQEGEQVVGDSQMPQGLNSFSSLQGSEELDFDDADEEMDTKASSETSFDSAEIEFNVESHHPEADIDEHESEDEDECDNEHMETEGQHSLISETNDIDLDAEYAARPIPLKVNGIYNVLALSQLALEEGDEDVLHTVHPENRVDTGPDLWSQLDDASVRTFIATKRPELLEEFDSQAHSETKFLSSQISSESSQPLTYAKSANAELVSSQTGLDTVPVMRTCGSHHKNNTRKPIFMTIEDTLNAVYEVAEATSFPDVTEAANDEPDDDDQTNGVAMLDALEDRPAIPDFDPEPMEETFKDNPDPLEEDEELDDEEAKYTTQSYAIRSTDIIDGFRHIELIAGPTIICNAPLFVNVAQELLVSKDTGFLMVFEGDEYLVGPRLAQV